MKIVFLAIILSALFFGFNDAVPVSAGIQNTDTITSLEDVSLIILGTVQDGGSPHIGCKKKCCKELFNLPGLHRYVVSLGIIDPKNHKKYIFDCSPDFPMQIRALHNHLPGAEKEMPDGIFLTHAHIGHYTGLMYLGKEAINADKINVYAMPRMKQFLENNGPWSQLVNNRNIILTPLANNQRLELTSNVTVTPVQVPHRDEYSETIGFIIEGPSKKILFIPDIDKWEKWDRDIIDMIAGVDYAFIDGTFYDGEEINNRNIASIPHPFIIETMHLFKDLSPKEKNKIHFIHLNHTNGALDSSSVQSKTIKENGFHVAFLHQVVKL